MKGVEWEDALRAVKWRDQSAVDRLTLVMEYIAGSFIHTYIHKFIDKFY